MSFAKTRPPSRPVRPERLQRSLLPLRTVVLAGLVIMAAAWALERHYSVVPPPMLVPARPAPAATYDPDAGEMPVPEIDLGDHDRR